MKHLISLICLLLFCCSLPVFSSAATASDAEEYRVTDVSFSGLTDSRPAAPVFYEIFTGSFSDADGDGIGDLRGVINRLDYLNDGDPASGLSLGVDGIWLTPVFQSPSYHKYDVTDYYTIDPSFGTMEDLKELIRACHARGIRLILDLPINHTGQRNRWFRLFTQSRQMGNTLNAYYDYYICVTAEEKLPGHTYERITGTELFYEANFSPSMPELNYDNEAVRRSVLDIAKYYLALGVDGFRFDAAKYIYFKDHASSAAFWQWYTDEIRKIKPDAYLVAEVWDSDGVTAHYTPFVSCFDFTVAQAEGLISATAQAGDVNTYTAYVEKYLQDLEAQGNVALYSPFIANHDTDRAAGYLPVTNGRIKVAANLYLLGPGSPFIYYGEEIGMKGSRGGANSDANRRLAMRWGDGDTVADPREATYDAGRQTTATVSSMKADPWSLYTYYKRLLMIRSAHPEIANGAYRALRLKDTKLGGFVSTWEDRSVMVLHNTTQRTITLDLAEIGEDGFKTISEIIGVGQAALEGSLLSLEGQTSVLLQP